MLSGADDLRTLAKRLQSRYASQVYVAAGYSKAELVTELERLADEWDTEIDVALRSQDYG